MKLEWFLAQEPFLANRFAWPLIGFAILFPLWYHNMCSDHAKKAQLRITNVVFIMFYLATCIVEFLAGLNQAPFSICNEPVVFNSIYYHLATAIGSTFVLSTVIFYMLILLRKRVLRQQNNVTSFVSFEVRKLNQAVYKSVGVIVAFEIGTSASTAILIIVVSMLFPHNLSTLAPYICLLLLLNGIAALPIYLVFIKRMRRDLRSLISSLRRLCASVLT